MTGEIKCLSKKMNILKGWIRVEKIKINNEYIKLEQLLKFAGIAESGANAKSVITEGNVKLNGIIELQRGKKIRSGDIVELKGKVIKVE